MKKYLVVVAAALCASTSCIRKQVVLDMADQRDSLTHIVNSKDSLIGAVFEQINAIAESLAQIKKRENMIAVPTDSEGSARLFRQIDGDIAAIDRLLQENRTKIASLQDAAVKLRKANLKVDGLEKMVRTLQEQVAEKSVEMERLRKQLTDREHQIAALEAQVIGQQTEMETLNDENTDLEHRLHAVYYIVGSERELRDAQIIDKEGFIGRTLTVGRSGAIDSFTHADARLLSEIPVGHKRATMVSAHPEGSYQWVIDSDKVVDKLVITDPTRFWESSRMLIVSYK